jgi:dipeptidyl aminopeptidase/acylaminoacyl peptidase
MITMITTAGESSGLVFLSTNDGSARAIDNITDEAISSLAWSRDGKRLAFSSNRINSDAVVLEEK